jgi:hypothetical protein
VIDVDGNGYSETNVIVLYLGYIGEDNVSVSVGGKGLPIYSPIGFTNVRN